MNTSTIPSSDIDLWSEPVLLDPYPAYRQLRELGPIVALDGYDLLAVTQYAETVEVLRDYERFTSAQGVGMNAVINRYGKGLLGSDPPFHDVLRRPLAQQLSPAGLKPIEAHVQDRADQLVEQLIDAGSFDVVRELAEPFTVAMVAGLIGLPEADRGRALEFAEATFTCYGPMNERTSTNLPKLEGFLEFCRHSGSRENLEPSGWGSDVYAAAERGEIPQSTAVTLISAYLGAGMDTTISAISSAVRLLGGDPQVWRELHANPRRLPGAISEVLRLESPIQRFSRVATRTTTLGDVEVREGQRLLVMYGCANRDERRFPEPDRLDVSRGRVGHLAFGFAVHSCPGQSLARLEAGSVLRALLQRVESFEVGSPVYAVNNISRRLSSLPVRVSRRR
jgi:cytochrome P450